MYAIVAVDENWGIGKDGQLLFHISADLKRFKEITSGHTVIMGRKTLQSLPGGKGLPNRRNIVLTTNPDFRAENAETVSTVMAAMFSANDAESICIGGATVYEQFLPVIDKVYVTKVLASKEADAFFPNLDTDPDWKVEQESEILEENGVRFQFVDYARVEKEFQPVFPKTNLIDD